MLSINSNLQSFIVQSSLKNSSSKLNFAIEKMTTGYKINHASDNAANYSIATSMSVKISAYQVAMDNTAMGLDLISTANDSLTLITSHLSRIRDLAIQSKNGTYGDNSQKAINSEVNARLDEIERLYSTTEYNSLKLFETKSGFIQEVTKRDTSSMTTLASVDENQTISSGTYSISTAEELAKLATMTNNGKVVGGEFVLANDIDLSAYSTGEGWEPIGTFGNKFKADFDGNGYVIKNLYINRPTEGSQGLFGEVEDSSIKNTGIENANITGLGDVGGFAGSLFSGSIDNCYAFATTIGDSCVGGLVGYADESSILNSYAISTVTGGYYVGGFIGSVGTYSLIENNYTIGTVTGEKIAGGFAGEADIGSILSNCYSITAVAGGNIVIGGFIGEVVNATFTDCYYDKEKSGQSDTGKGEGISSAEIKEKMFAAGLLKQDNSLHLLQVGIHSGDESKIELSTSFSLDNISELRNIGLNDGNYLETIDKILASISAKQTEYGACQNRLESALEEINTHYENLVSSRSTLRDADMAELSSTYIQQQILQQASATLMATANQTSDLALQLIGQL